MVSFLKLVFMVLVLFVMNCSTSQVYGQDPDKDLRTFHEAWMKKHGKEYANNIEKEARFHVFKDNHAFVTSFNNQTNKTYKLGMNRFADMTQEEFINSHSTPRTPPKSDPSSRRPFINTFKYYNVRLTSLAESFDWSEHGAVTPVKNQGDKCNGCYSFAAAGTIESIIQIKTGKLTSLSEQQVLDCSTKNDGCNGGLSGEAFDYIQQAGGLTTESNYPYTANVGACKDANFPKAATIKGYESVPANNEQALLQALANQPISVSIDDRKVQLYSHGVMTGECGTDLNHELLLVGYGTDSDGTQFWRMKNSWGTEWGEEGYLRLERNVDDPKGMCGIAMMATYPNV